MGCDCFAERKSSKTKEEDKKISQVSEIVYEEKKPLTFKKVLKMTDDAEEFKKMYGACKLAQSLAHPFTLRSISVTQSSNELNMEYEYCTSNLKALIADRKIKGEKISETEILSYFAQLCLAIDAIHNKRVNIKQLQTRKIYLSNFDEVRIGNYHYMTPQTEAGEKTDDMTNSGRFEAPELDDEGEFDEKADIWALGVILHEMCSLDVENERPVTFERVKSEAYGETI